MDKKRIYILLAGILAVAFIVEFFFAEPHHHMIWNLVPGADIIIGFAGAWLVILVAKKILATALQRKTDYYDGGGHDEL